jgi:hypothetical protein
MPEGRNVDLMGCGANLAGWRHPEGANGASTPPTTNTPNEGAGGKAEAVVRKETSASHHQAWFGTSADG